MPSINVHSAQSCVGHEEKLASKAQYSNVLGAVDQGAGLNDVSGSNWVNLIHPV